MKNICVVTARDSVIQNVAQVAQPKTSQTNTTSNNKDSHNWPQARETVNKSHISNMDCPRWSKTAKILTSKIQTKRKEDNYQVQGITLKKQLWSCLPGDALLGGIINKAPEGGGTCLLSMSTVSAKKGAQLACVPICIQETKKPKTNNINTPGKSFTTSQLSVVKKTIRHRIKTFVWIQPHRAYLCYCPNELVIRMYKVDLLTSSWLEVMRMPVYPHMNDLKYCDYTDEVFGCSRGTITVWKMVPLGTGAPLRLLPPENHFISNEYLKEDTWVYQIKIFEHVLVAILSCQVLLFHVENRSLLDVVTIYHCSSPVSDVFLWFKNLEVGLKDDTIAMIVGNRDGSVSLISNVNVITRAVHAKPVGNHNLVYHQYIHTKGAVKFICFNMHAGVAPVNTTNQGNLPAQIQKEKAENLSNTTFDLKPSFSQTSILAARKQSSEKTTSTSTLACFLSWSNQDNFIKCSRISDGEKLYDFCLEQDKIKAYDDGIKTVMRNFKDWAKLPTNLQNLSKIEKTGLAELEEACGKEIMIVPSDKDQKIVILDFDDYIRLVKAEVDKNFVTAKLPSKNEEEILKQKCRDKCEILFKHGIISEKCLYGTVGLGYDKQLDTTYKTRHYASQFDGDFKKGFCHVYPLMKTHKETEDNKFEKPDDCPMRLVTAANRSPLTKISTMLDYTIQEHVKKYCGEEYTKDTFEYIKDIEDKNIRSEDNLSVVCLDVTALYPSACRKTTLLAVRDCISKIEPPWHPEAVDGVGTNLNVLLRIR